MHAQRSARDEDNQEEGGKHERTGPRTVTDSTGAQNNCRRHTAAQPDRQAVPDSRRVQWRGPEQYDGQQDIRQRGRQCAPHNERQRAAPASSTSARAAHQRGAARPPQASRYPKGDNSGTYRYAHGREEINLVSSDEVINLVSSDESTGSEDSVDICLVGRKRDRAEADRGRAPKR